jgi:hypothetical protein
VRNLETSSATSKQTLYSFPRSVSKYCKWSDFKLVYPVCHLQHRKTDNGVRWYPSIIPATPNKDFEFEDSLGKIIGTLWQKQSTNKRAENMAQVVERLPGMHQAEFIPLHWGGEKKRTCRLKV